MAKQAEHRSIAPSPDFIINLHTCSGEHDSKGWAAALDALGIVSLVFSCVFMADLLASMWAFGREYVISPFFP